MADISHWDFAENFSGYEVAALILGLEPSELLEGMPRIRVITDRLELDFKRALKDSDAEFSLSADSLEARKAEGVISLPSVRLLELEDGCWGLGEDGPLLDWIEDQEQTKFDLQKFSRAKIVLWIAAAGVNSVYRFDKKMQPPTDEGSKSQPPADLDSTSQTISYIDPAELPEELDAANIAYRAVLNGFGETTGTFKTRLVYFLKLNYPKFKSETVERIAMVANPDKSPGRRKREL